MDEYVRRSEWNLQEYARTRGKLVVYHAAMLDRHAASTLSLDEIEAVVDELIEAHGHALPIGLQ